MRTKIRLDIYRQTVQLVIFFYLRLMFYAYVQRFDVTVTMQIFFWTFLATKQTKVIWILECDGSVERHHLQPVLRDTKAFLCLVAFRWCKNECKIHVAFFVVI
jgi:hypothetical protein